MGGATNDGQTVTMCPWRSKVNDPQMDSGRDPNDATRFGPVGPERA